MRLLQLSCDLQTLNLALIYCHTDLNSVHINILCLSQVIFQYFLLKDQFPVPVTIESVHLPYLSHIDLVDDWSPVQRHPGTANPHLLSSTASTPDDIAVDYAVWPLAFLIPRGPTLQPFSHPSHLLSSREETVSSTASSSIVFVNHSAATETTPQVKYAPDFRRAGQCG